MSTNGENVMHVPVDSMPTEALMPLGLAIMMEIAHRNGNTLLQEIDNLRESVEHTDFNERMDEPEIEF